MKTMQARVDESVDEFIGKLQTVVGEYAVEVIEERLTKRRRKQCHRVSPHRTADEISALAESVYAQICQQPGETMMVLAKAVGQSSAALALPARKLLATGRVKKTGQHAETRYFPVGPKPMKRRGRQR
jgi:hypothetical protein